MTELKVSLLASQPDLHCSSTNSVSLGKDYLLDSPMADSLRKQDKSMTGGTEKTCFIYNRHLKSIFLAL